MPEILLNQRQIYYESHGDGFPLILIRGFGSCADHWYAQTPDFSSRYRVVTFDNRGVARSSDSQEPFTIKDMADDTIGLMDGLRIKRAHILGLSMGGMIAQEIAIGHPRRVKGLILASTHCGGKGQERAAPNVLQSFERLITDGSLEARLKAFSHLFAPHTMRDKPNSVQKYLSVSAKHPVSPDALKKQGEAVQGHDACDRLQLIESHTLVLTGSADELVPPVNSTILAEAIPRSELVIIQGCGHQVLIEEPQICNQAMMAFLQRVDAITE
jgi:pimeloyl-ACP methyl ester carboxylesterase